MIKTLNDVSLQKEITINMPQMAIEALSENWLFKELGDIHWELICKGLNTKSFDLKNETDDRLYATFVRIQIACQNGNLKSIKENENVKLEGKIQRYGNSMYFSDIHFNAANETIAAKLMTTFSIRNHDNSKLAKGEPGQGQNDIKQLLKLPKFGNEYRLVKKKVLKQLVHKDANFKIGDKILFETEYELNPFYDINGVNLLYFAAYPIINDVCEAKFFNSKNLGFRWEQNYRTAFKDVFYYANCNLNDTLIYQLEAYEQIDESQFQINSLLRRKSDGAIIARIFSIKIKTPTS